MLLLRERFLLCDDHMAMRLVFLHEPCKLLLADVQKAWLLLHQNVPYIDISRCNRVKSVFLDDNDDVRLVVINSIIFYFLLDQTTVVLHM